LITLSKLERFFNLNGINYCSTDRNCSLHQYVDLMKKRPKKGKTSFLNERSFSFVRSGT